MVGVGQVVLAQERPQLEVVLLVLLVLLVDQVLYLLLELPLHLPDLWRDDVPQHFIHSRNLVKLFGC